MPYTISPEIIERVQKILDALMVRDSDVAFATEEPHKLAYQLHNAISAASYIKEYERYASLRSKFRIRARPGRLVCEVRSHQRIVTYGTTVPETAVTPASQAFPDVDTIAGIMGIMVQTKKDKAFFPEAILDQESLALLYNWTSAEGYHIINHEEGGLTLTKEHTDLEWKPSATQGP